VGTAAQRAGGNSQSVRHLFVVFDLVMSIVKVVVENQVTLLRSQNPQAYIQAFELAGNYRICKESYRGDFHRDLPSAPRFSNYVSSHAVEVPGWFSAVRILDVWQPCDNPVNRFVREVFRIV